MKELIGTGVALVTPFDADGYVDVAALSNIVHYQVEHGINYLVVMGTTAESVTLNKEEKQLVIDTVIDANAGRLPLVLGIGGNNTNAVINEIRSRDLTAFSAILSVSPMYNKPTQEGIYQHFAAIASSTEMPIVLYNVPGRTAKNMTPETVARLAKDFDNVVAIKEAGNDIVQAMNMIDQTPDDFLVISGDDILALPMVLAGGSGVISVIGQGFPKDFSAMIQLGLERKVDQAYAIHYKLSPAIDYIFEEGNPAGIKSVFEALDICGSHVRLPLVQATASLKAKIADYVSHY